MDYKGEEEGAFAVEIIRSELLTSNHPHRSEMLLKWQLP